VFFSHTTPAPVCRTLAASMTMCRRAALEFDFARRTCISLARPFHLSAEQFDPNYLLRASTVPNLKDSHTPAVHLEQEPHSQRQDSNGNSRDRMRSVRGASVVLRVDGGEAGHQPPHRFHVKEEEGDDDPTPPSAGSAPTSPPGQKAFIDTEVAGVTAVEDQFQVQMAVRDAAARRTRRGGLALRPPPPSLLLFTLLPLPPLLAAAVKRRPTAGSAPNPPSTTTSTRPSSSPRGPPPAPLLDPPAVA